METAVKICRILYNTLSEETCVGTISYFDRNEIDVESPIGIVRILSGETLLPFSCLVTEQQPFTSLSIFHGMQVTLRAKEIDIPDADYTVSLTLAEPTDLSVSGKGLFLPVDLPQRLRYLQRAVEISAEQGEFSGLILENGPAAPYDMSGRLDTLAEAFSDEDAQQLRAAASACAGLGSGRTPASDSLLAGFILGYCAFSAALGRREEHILSVTEPVVAGAYENTTRESAFWLLLAARGLCEEDGCQLFRCLFSDKIYTSVLACASRAAAQNGCDWLTGVYAYLKHCKY